ncbi:MAG: TRAP transporter substrate-binding protein [Rubrivivax sp.]
MDKARRRISTGLAAAVFAPALTSVVAQGQMRLTLAHNLTPSNPKGIGADTFAEFLSQKSGGRMTVHVAHSSQLGNENTNMSALRTGTLDFGALGLGALLSVAPECAAVGLPFLYPNLKAAWGSLDGPIGQELAKRIEAKNIVFLGWWCNGLRQTTNAKRQILTPGDLKGLRIRTPLDPSTVDMFAAMGAIPQQIAWGEVYLALQTGVVDGQENPLVNIDSAKLYEVQSNLSFTNHKYEPTALLMSAAAWGKLSEADRKIVLEAAKQTQPIQRKAMADSDETFRLKFEKLPNFKMSTVDTAPFKQATEVVWDEWEKKPFGDFVKKLRATRS